MIVIGYILVAFLVFSLLMIKFDKRTKLWVTILLASAPVGTLIIWTMLTSITTILLFQ